jgi:drug/metabolite transporter (DMT)-like permease
MITMTDGHADMSPKRQFPRGVGFSLLAAMLFGGTTPLAKLLLGDVTPVLLAALFYLGSGAGLTIVSFVRRKSVVADAPLSRKDFPWLAGALLSGGILAPVLLMLGLSTTPGSMTSLLLNLESVFTVLIAWFIVRENFDKRIALGMLFILAGGILLSYQGELTGTPSLGALAIAGACLCWGIDNNFTQKVSAGNPIQIAAIKGVVSGGVNLVIALVLGAHVGSMAGVAAALAVGFFGYGVSLVLFVQALRHVGTARTSAYFSTAPFIGAIASVLFLRESTGFSLLGAGLLMGIGVWLHLTERHQHEHTHRAIVHDHQHVHDEHHQHSHTPGIDSKEPHAHLHAHEPLTHSHQHYPDIHHRHPH